MSDEHGSDFVDELMEFLLRNYYSMLIKRVKRFFPNKFDAEDIVTETIIVLLNERRYRRTQLVNAFLSAASANRQCLPEIAASACGLLAMTIRGWCHFNANLYRLFLQSRAGLLIVQKRCPALELQSGAEQISFLRRRPSCP